MIKVTTTAAKIFDVDFGVFTSAVGLEKSTFQKHKIGFSIIPISGDSPRYVRVELQDNGTFSITTAAAWVNLPPEYKHILGVSEIDGVAPVDVDDLYNKLKNSI